MYKIRHVEIKDAQKLLEIYSYYVENTAITFEYDTPSLEEFTDRIKSISKKYPYIVIEEENEIIGYAYANVFKDRAAYNWTVEYSIYVSYEFSGQGVGIYLHNEIVKRLQEKNISTIEACITYPNEASIKFHEKLGYKKVAHFNKVGYKFNKWHDVVWYEKKIKEQI